MDIKHESNDQKGAFFIEQDGERLAEMTYVRTGPSSVIVDHTHVAPLLKGQGAGKRLVAAAVAFAREHHLRIVPLCPFTRAEFEKSPDYADVWIR